MPESVRELQLAGITIDFVNSDECQIPKHRKKKITTESEINDHEEDDSDADNNASNEKRGDANAIQLCKEALKWWEMGDRDVSPKYKLDNIREFVKRQMQPCDQEANERQAIRLLRLQDIAKRGYLDKGSLLSHFVLHHIEELRKMGSDTSYFQWSGK